MTPQQEAPSGREGIQFFDEQLAKCMLVTELLQIPEFGELLRRVRYGHSAVIEAIQPYLREVGASLSPQARGAFAMGEKSSSLYGDKAIHEANQAAIKFQIIGHAGEQALQNFGITSDSRVRLEEFIDPLGVPDLVDFVMYRDVRLCELNTVLFGPISGALLNLLECTILDELTGLCPLETLGESPAKIRKRLVQRTAPLRRHVESYNLNKRIQLWVRNVVFGEPISMIADEIQKEAKRTGEDREPEEWVRKQIREACKILGVKRVSGRPRKGGVLRYWKMMLD